MEGIDGLRVLLSLVVVLASIVGFSRILRRPLGGDAAWAEQLGTTELQGGTRLHLLQVAGRVYLLASSLGGGVQCIDRWSENDRVGEDAASGESASFADEDPPLEVLAERDSRRARSRALEAFESLKRIRGEGK